MEEDAEETKEEKGGVSISSSTPLKECERCSAKTSQRYCHKCATDMHVLKFRSQTAAVKSQQQPTQRRQVATGFLERLLQHSKIVASGESSKES
jgi:hypothetical protein